MSWDKLLSRYHRVEFDLEEDHEKIKKLFESLLNHEGFQIFTSLILKEYERLDILIDGQEGTALEKTVAVRSYIKELLTEFFTPIDYKIEEDQEDE